ncbi:Glutamate receptor 2.8 [Acorus calamus]|uniref:Glutamate receptor n=1 Tax=Acorus calamus TaxID=4465 RepID=A0AAV9FCZ2_ACOCL|nr:Glutamate receptor 2.8 [Acorus calamus]
MMFSTRFRCCFTFFFISFSFTGLHHRWVMAQENFSVGVILGKGSLLGETGWTSISMAVDDFYAAHPNYSTRLVLHFEDSKEDIIGAASAALDLLKINQVVAIIGPQKSTQAKFIADLGNSTRVPILSFSALSSSISPAFIPYFVRTALNDSSQAAPIAALVQHFQWREVVTVYEDSDFSTGALPHIVDALQDAGARVPYRCAIPPYANNDYVLKELYKLKTEQTRVFVVHASSSLGERLFPMLEEAGMMSEGYAWIITDGLTSLLDSMNASVLNSMQGVLGVKPYVEETKRLIDFKARWKKRIIRADADIINPSVFAYWAYDTVWALALALENFKIENPDLKNLKPALNASADLANLGSSPIGPKLRQSLLTTSFNGLSGKFNLVSGQLESSAFEIVNVLNNGKRRIGVWTPSKGILASLNSGASVVLKPVIWPGESTIVPKGWEIPVSGKKLQIGVPVKPGFPGFVDVVKDPVTGQITASGFSIEVFDMVMKALPYGVAYEYIVYEDAKGNSNGSYDDLVYQVYLKKFDAVVGDITIIANRSQYVEFTLPYTESGVSMLVPVKDDRSRRAWVFLDPLTPDLWLVSGAFFIFTGFVIWVLEHRINEEFRGEPSYQIGTVSYFVFSTLVFAHKEKMVSNLSKVVVIIWVFVVLILTSSYTASLTSMLTVQKLQPTVTNIDDLIKNKDYVGYLHDSFVLGLLERMKIPKDRLRNLTSPDDYYNALLKGSKNGGVAAVFDEVPYLKVFLSQYCDGHTMVGPTYKTDGFGFVFPIGSPLVPDVSRAILNVTEGNQMDAIMKKLYGSESCQDQSSTIASNSLTFDSFWGLFLITGVASFVALVVFVALFIHQNREFLMNTVRSESTLREKIAHIVMYYDAKDLSSPAFKKTASADGPAEGGATGVVDAHITNNSRTPSSISDHTYENFTPEEERSPYVGRAAWPEVDGLGTHTPPDAQ